jgi:manganese transport protein
VRRLFAVVPCIVVLGLGINATTALIWSQVVLSFALPGTLVPLLLFTRDRSLMGVLANRPATTVVAGGITVVIVMLCGFLLHAG